MDFETCFAQNKYLLLEGALGSGSSGSMASTSRASPPWRRSFMMRLAAGLCARFGRIPRHRAEIRPPFLATTPTRRANRERTAQAGYDKTLLRDNVAFLKEVREQTGGESGMYVGALMGCRGDAYRADDVLAAGEARVFHSWAADAFAEAGVEFLYAGILPALCEAIGMAQAMEQTGLPYLVSFMIRKNGRLMDGTPIAEAIAAIDAAVSRPRFAI